MKLSKYFGLLILTAFLTSLTLLFWTCIPLPPRHSSWAWD
jgi:hypothetical protein